MKSSRRDVLRLGGGAGVYALAVSVGLIVAPEAEAQTPAWNKAAFEGKSFAEVARALGAPRPVESAAITFANPTPDIAENGAVVPVTVASKLPGTESISILIPGNPNTLAASFNLGPGMDPFVSTRVKMSESSEVIALVKAQGRYHYAKKQIMVTIGGCGG